MTDTTLVLRKLTTLLEHASRVERRRPERLEEFQNDTDRQDALALSLVVALQEAVDVSLHMAADEGWGIASSYAESFELLAAHGVFSLGLSATLGSVAALRNRVAHGYGSVDFERLWRESPAGVSALRSFAAAVAAFIEPPPDRKA